MDIVGNLFSAIPPGISWFFLGCPRDFVGLFLGSSRHLAGEFPWGSPGPFPGSFTGLPREMPGIVLRLFVCSQEFAAKFRGVSQGFQQGPQDVPGNFPEIFKDFAED